MGAFIWYFLRLFDDSPGGSERRAGKTLTVLGIFESVSVCIRGICITCDGILEYHLEIRRESGWTGWTTTEAMQKSCAVCFISRSFPAIPEAKCRLLFNESVLTFRIWRWVCLIPKWNMKLLSSSYFQRGICHREFTNLWDLARLSGRISQRVEAQTMCHLLRLGCTL
jgi:hypothetical protein